MVFVACSEFARIGLAIKAPGSEGGERRCLRFLNDPARAMLLISCCHANNMRRHCNSQITNVAIRRMCAFHSAIDFTHRLSRTIDPASNKSSVQGTHASRCRRSGPHGQGQGIGLRRPGFTRAARSRSVHCRQRCDGADHWRNGHRQGTAGTSCP